MSKRTYSGHTPAAMAAMEMSDQADSVLPNRRSASNDVKGEPVQVLTRTPKGGPFADHLMYTMRTGMHFHQYTHAASGNDNDNVLHLTALAAPASAGPLDPLNILDPLGGMSDLVQPYWLDQLFALYGKAAVLTAGTRWHLERNELSDDLTTMGFYMVAVVTPGSSESTVINGTSLRAIPISYGTGVNKPKRIHEFLRAHSHDVKMAYKFVPPTQDGTITGKHKRYSLDLPVDPCMFDDVAITPAEIIYDDPNIDGGSFFATSSAAPASTNRPYIHLYIVGAHGGQNKDFATGDSFYSSFEMKLNTYWKDPVNAGFSIQ